MTDQVLDPPRRRPIVLGQQAGLVVILVLLGALFTSKSPGFLSSFNLFVLGRSLAIDIVIGFSQMVVLATGGMWPIPWRGWRRSCWPWPKCVKP